MAGSHLFCFYEHIYCVIQVCPHCGHGIPEVLVNGLASCQHCSRLFSSSLANRLLAASWMMRKNHYQDLDRFISDTKIPEYEAILVYSFVVENQYSQEDFLHVLNTLGIKD